MPSTALPLAQFFRLLPSARPPQRADRAACGTLPTRAFRYCEAATSASAFGWWLFPPMDLQLLWDGSDIFWHYEGAADWLPLLPSCQAPGFAAAFDAAAPADLHGCSPPMLTALPEAGTLQIWTGLIARTAPDWHLLVRAPANLPAIGGLAFYEGIVATDRWFGPLFTNLRFTRSHAPIRLRADFPVLQAQPIPRQVYGDASLSAMQVVPALDALSDDDWAAYRRTIVVPNQDVERPFGAYAAAARKAQHEEGRCPFSAGSRR